MPRFYSLCVVFFIVTSISALCLFHDTRLSCRDLLATVRFSTSEILSSWASRTNSPEQVQLRVSNRDTEITTPVSLTLISSPSSLGDVGGGANLNRDGAIPVISSEASSQQLDKASQKSPAVTEGLKYYLHSISQSLMQYFLQVRRVEIIGNIRVPREKIHLLADLETFSWVWKVPKQKIMSRLTRNPWIESAKLELSLFPGKLKIMVTEAEPWVVAEIDSHSWLVSRSGYLLQALDTLDDADLVVESSKLPRVLGLGTSDFASSAGSLANQRFLYLVRSLKFIDAAGGFPFEVESYEPQPDGSVLVVPMDFLRIPRVIVSPKTFTEAEKNMRELRFVLSDIKLRAEEVAEIDLRYHQQAVVRYRIAKRLAANEEEELTRMNANERE